MDLVLIQFVAADPSETLPERTANLFPVRFMQGDIPNFPLATDGFIQSLSQGFHQHLPSDTLTEAYRLGKMDDTAFERRCRMELVAHMSMMTMLLITATHEAEHRGLQGIALICNSPGKCQCRIMVDMVQSFQAKRGALEIAMYQGYRF